MTAEPRDELHRLVDEIVMAPGWREALRAAVAAADRENAELRGEIERLRSLAGPIREGYEASEAMRRDARAERDDLRAQLAAAQAQLAEALSVLHEFVNVRGDFYEPRPLAAMIERLAPSLGFALRSDWRTFVSREREAATAEARLEAVRALCYRPGHRTLSPTEVLAALSAAPQPEPSSKARVGDTVTATLRGKLISYDADMGKWTLETDGTDHIAWQIELHWAQPFEVVQHESEPPASDEPARCSTCGGSFDSPGCCKSPDDDRPRAEAGFHTVDGGRAASSGPR